VSEIDQLDQRFPSSHRIRHGADFKRVYDRRQRVSDSVLIVYGCENDLAVSRLGLSVSRRVGPAHFRNRWKRLIRESFRRLPGQLEPGYDFVVIPRPRIEPEFQTIRQSLAALTRRLQRNLKKRRT
jgi:ribonuclease P protein component